MLEFLELDPRKMAPRSRQTLHRRKHHLRTTVTLIWTLSTVFTTIGGAVPAPKLIVRPAGSLGVNRSELAGVGGRSVDGQWFALFAGGYDSLGNDSGLVDVLNVAAGVWHNMTLPSGGRGVLAAGSAAGHAVFCGGQHSGGNRTAACDIIELGSLTWQPGLRLSVARSMIAAVTLGTKIFFAGGELAENRSAPAATECSDAVGFLRLWCWCRASGADAAVAPASPPRFTPSNIAVGHFA